MFAQGGIFILKSLKPAGPIKTGLCCLQREEVSSCLQTRHKKRNGHGLGGRTNDRVWITQGSRDSELTMLTGPGLLGFGQQWLTSIPVGKDFEFVWLAPGSGFRMICEENLKLYRSFSAKVWRASNFLTSKSAKVVLGSGFIVMIWESTKTRGWEGPGEVREGKIFSSNWQFWKRALCKTPDLGETQWIILGESNPTYIFLLGLVMLSNIKIISHFMKINVAVNYFSKVMIVKLKEVLYTVVAKLDMESWCTCVAILPLKYKVHYHIGGTSNIRHI